MQYYYFELAELKTSSAKTFYTNCVVVETAASRWHRATSSFERSFWTFSRSTFARFLLQGWKKIQQLSTYLEINAVILDGSRTIQHISRRNPFTHLEMTVTHEPFQPLYKNNRAGWFLSIFHDSHIKVLTEKPIQETLNEIELARNTTSRRPWKISKQPIPSNISTSQRKLSKSEWPFTFANYIPFNIPVVSLASKFYLPVFVCLCVCLFDCLQKGSTHSKEAAGRETVYNGDISSKYRLKHRLPKWC